MLLHIPAAEALARDWATARGIPHGPVPDDLAGVDAVAALPGPVPARVCQLRLELFRPDFLVLPRGPGGGRVGVLCVRTITHVITGTCATGAPLP